MSAAIGMMGSAARPSIAEVAFKALKSALPKEPHPFFISSATKANQPIAMRWYATRIARTASFYVPLYVVFLGWPFAAKEIIERTGALSRKK